MSIDPSRAARSGPFLKQVQTVEPCSRRAVPTNEVFNIEATDSALLDHPLSADHDTIRLVSAAQYKSCQRVAGPGETKLIQLEESEIGDLAGLDFTKFRTADASCRAFRRPAQCIAMTHSRDAIAAALKQECGAHFLDEIGTIVRRGAVDADTDPDTSLLEIADRTTARRKHLVAAGAMADCRSRSCQTCHLIGVEMNSVREPRPLA